MGVDLLGWCAWAVVGAALLMAVLLAVGAWRDEADEAEREIAAGHWPPAPPRPGRMR